MRSAVASLSAAAVIAAALVLTCSTASAQPAGAAATVVPYQLCEQWPPATSSCSTGVIRTHQTATPSGNTSVSVIDNGRFETVNSETGCTTTGSYQLSGRIAIGPEAIQRIVVQDSSRTTVRTRCGDRTVDSQCVYRATTSAMILPDKVTLESRIWSPCDARTDDPAAG